MSSTFHCPVLTYQQFTPRDGNGWHQHHLDFSTAHTAVVVMHAWAPPGAGQLPGWSRAVPYLKEIAPILRNTFPPLLQAVRQNGIPVFHVTGNVPPAERPALEVPTDPTWEHLRVFRSDHVFPGAPNQTDVAARRSHR